VGKQGSGLAGKPSFRGDLWEWRYRPSLDLSPWVDSPTTTSSLDRLDPNAASNCESSGCPGTTAMPAGGGPSGPTAGGVPSGPDTRPSSAV
jgi:hypothetical protein